MIRLDLPYWEKGTHWAISSSFLTGDRETKAGVWDVDRLRICRES